MASTSNSTVSYTFTGFGTKVTLGGQTICTGATVNIGQKIINSQGSFFGGVIFDPSSDDGTIQANGPFRMDVPQITVDLSFQMTVSLLEEFLQLLKNRKTAKNVVIEGSGGKLELSNCYWNKISLQVQQNSLMTGSVSFNVIQEYETIYSYVMRARNSNDAITNQNNFGLYGENFGCHIIPYYATLVSINGGPISFGGTDNPTSENSNSSDSSLGSDSVGINFIPMAWSLDISQQISTRTFCKKYSSSSTSSDSLLSSDQGPIIQFAKKPRIAFGILSCNLNVTTLVDVKNGVKLSNLIPYITFSDTLTSSNNIQIKYLDDNMSEQPFLKLEFLQLVSATPNYTDPSNYMSVQLNYQANKITIEPKDPPPKQ